MEHVERILRTFSSRRILLVGDVMLDEYLWGDIQRISPEAPVPILNLVRRESTLGGAGNVAKNLRSLGAQVTVLGVVGEDDTGDQILELLDQAKADRSGVLHDPQRRSTRKTRLMSLEHGQQVFRLDEESPHWVSGGVEEALLAHLRAKIVGADAVLCSDYWKGMLTARVLQTAFHHARQLDLPVVVAPKDSTPEKYRGAGVLIPNVKELAQLARATPDRTEWLGRAAKELIWTLEIEALLVTRGREGISLFERSADAVRRVDIPTVARTVYDVTGAGDTVVSVFTLAVAAGADHETAARWANAAGGLVVGKRGTAWVTVEELQEQLQEEKRVVPVPEGMAPIPTLKE